MAADIVMPRIYKGMSEGTLVKWFKNRASSSGTGICFLP